MFLFLFNLFLMIQKGYKLAVENLDKVSSDPLIPTGCWLLTPHRARTILLCYS
jgi:hypothetical protein